MGLTYVYMKHLIVGLLLSATVTKHVTSEHLGTYLQTHSFAWHGSAPFSKFFLLDSAGNDDKLHIVKLMKSLTANNQAYKKLEDSDILAAEAKLDVKIIGTTTNNVNSVVTLHLVLNTSNEANVPKHEGISATVKTLAAKSVDEFSQIKSKPAHENRNAQPNNKFVEDVLARHNMYRKKHKAPPLVHNKKISQVSQDWANKLAEKDEFRHRPKGQYGENLYFAWSSDSKYTLQPNAAVDSWYSEVKNYSYTKSADIALTGHFTQLVWKNTKELGVGVAKSKTNRHYVVCNYNPRGNIVGSFGENVLKP